MNRNNFLKTAASVLGLSLLAKKSNATYIPTGASLPYVQKPTASKKLLIFGDSITETVIRTGNWPAQISNLSFTNIYNSYAISGARYKDFAGASTNQQASDQITAAISDGRNPDYIIFALGTNDQELSLGSYSTAMGKATLNDLDRTLLYEALRWCYWKCATQWSSAIIFAVLPLQRADVDITAMTNLRTAITSMANRYNVKIIDGTFESGIISDFEVISGSGRYLSDGVHPNTAGSQMVAKLISSKMISYCEQ